MISWPNRRRAVPDRKRDPLALRPRASPRRAARLARRPSHQKRQPKPRAKRRAKPNGSIASATARPRAAPTCATSSAARARASPRWPISACRCRPASPSPPRSARTSTPTANAIPTDLRAQVDAALDRGRPHHRQGIRRRRQSAAGVGALGRARVDAGHDGHGAQSRPQRRDGRGAGEANPATGASPTTAIAASSRCIPTSCSASAIITSRKSSTTTRTATATRSTPISTADDWVELVGRYKERRRGGARRAVPAGPARAAVGRDRRRVRLLDEPARHHLSPPARHPGKLGHRGQRAGHGVRQYGRDLGDRRRLHAQSLDRREEALRRVPDQCPGRGRGRRHPHAAGDHRGRAQGGRLRQAVDGKGDAGRRSPS